MAKTVIFLLVAAFSGFVSAQRGDIPADPTLEECRGKAADVFFLLDSSSSIWVVHYEQVLEFLADVISRLDIRSDDTRIGALTFSDNFEVGFDLDTFTSKAVMLAAVNKETLPYKAGLTNTHLAIRHVRRHAHFRPNVTKVMVVVTDGGSRYPTLTKEEARLAKEEDGIYMVVVGTGTYQEEGEWKAIASDPDSHFIFNVTDYDLLQTLSDRLPRVLCPLPVPTTSTVTVTTPAPTTPLNIFQGECAVTEEADLFFLASRTAVDQAYDVISQLTPSFRSRARLHVRYVMDVCDNRVDRGFQGLDRHCDRKRDVQEQDNVGLMSELRTAAETMRSARSAANQLAVIFLDPASVTSSRAEIVEEVQRIRDDYGINIIFVDVGAGSDASSYVRGLTSNEKDVIKYPGPDMMDSLQELLDRICEIANFSFGPEPDSV